MCEPGEWGTEAESPIFVWLRPSSLEDLILALLLFILVTQVKTSITSLFHCIKGVIFFQETKPFKSEITCLNLK